MTLLAKTNARILKKKINIVKLFKARCNEIPADFMAANS